MKQSNQGWDITLYIEGTVIWASLELEAGLKLSRVGVFGVESLNPFQRLSVKKVDHSFCVFGGGLLGGGACISTKENRLEPIRWSDLPRCKAENLSEENQQKASRIAGEIEEQARLGIFSSLQLAELEDIPLVTIEAPFVIARRLLSVLYCYDIWTNKFHLQLRYTLARLTRRFIVDYFLHNPTIFTADNQEVATLNSELAKLASVKLRAKELDSGVKAEIEVVEALVHLMRRNQNWERDLEKDASLIFSFYFNQSPVAVVITPDQVAQIHRKQLTEQGLIERALLIDSLYITQPAEALQSFVALMELEHPWETQYMALAYLEWGIHRDLFSTFLLCSLKPTLQRLIGLKRREVNEKLLTILFKLKSQGLFVDLLEVLEREATDTAAIFVNLPLAMLAPEPRLSALNNICDDNFALLGRVQELAEVKALVAQESCVSIVGLPGIGKTSLSTRVAKELVPYFQIVWICRADTEDSLAISLKTLAAKLNVEANAKENYRLLMNELNSYEKVLLVLDNAKEICEPLANGRVHLLLTSMNASIGGRTFKLDKWKESTALNYIREGTERADEETDLLELVRMLCGVPLSLKLAKSYVHRNRDVPISVLINKLAAQSFISPEQTVQAAVMIAECISKAKELYPPVDKLLWLSALLSSEGVPRDVYVSIFADVFESADFRECRAEAKSYSLVEEDSSGALSMHTLVQQTVLSQVRMSESLPDLMASISRHLKTKDRQQEVLRCTKPTTSFLIAQGFNADSIDFCMNFLNLAINLEGISHDKAQQLATIYDWVLDHELVLQYMRAKTIFRFAKNLSLIGRPSAGLNLLLRVKQEIEAQGTMRGSLYNVLGDLYMHSGDMIKAERYYLRRLEIWEEELDPNHTKLATLYNSLGMLYKANNNMPEAEKYLLKSLAIYQEGLDPNHPSLAMLYNNLGKLYRANDNLEEAEKYLLKSLAIWENVLEIKHPNLGKLYNNLGKLYTATGDIDSAEKYYLKFLAIKEGVLEPKHPELAAIYCQLGMLEQTSGNLEKAESYLLKCLEIWEGVCEPRHPSLAIVYDALRSLYKSIGREEEALKYLDLWMATQESA
jgi:tetratricopeptide (TPR) repeat protein